jgi:hypothetical protein
MFDLCLQVYLRAWSIKKRSVSQGTDPASSLPSYRFFP